MHHALEHSRVGQAHDVVARLTPLGAHRLDLADAEALPEQVVETYAGGQNLTANLGMRTFALTPGESLERMVRYVKQMQAVAASGVKLR